MKIGFIRVEGQFAVNLRNQHILEFLKRRHKVYEHKIDESRFTVPFEFNSLKGILKSSFILTAMEKMYRGSQISFSRTISINKFISNAKVIIEQEYRKLMPLAYSLDMLHAEDIFSGYICYEINKRKGIPYVFDLHDIYYESFRAQGENPTKIRFYDEMEYKITRSATDIICVSDLAKSRLRELYNIPPERIDVIKNGTLLAKDKASYSRPFRVIYGGNLHDVERVRDFIEARVNLPSEEVEFYLMGDGPHRERYFDFINKKGLDIIYLGLKPWQKAMKIFGRMQVGIVPGSEHLGRRASCPMKALDYAGSGLPIIIPESYDFSKYVKKYNAGILIRTSSAKDIAEGIRALMDEGRWEEISSNARRMVEKEFLWDEVLVPLEGIYA